MGQTAKVLDHAKGKKTREERKAERGSLFSQKAKYAGAKNKLTLHLRETKKGGPFKVYALLEKHGADKKEKGMVTELKTQAEAQAKYDEIAAQCVAAGWKMVTKVTKSAFDAIPPAA